MQTVFRQLAAQELLLDIVVNNAGIVPRDNFVLTEAGHDDSLHGVFEVNTYGVFYGLKHAPACMQDFGSIINTASLAAHLALPGNSQYSASKAAVVQLTRTSAVELGVRGIRVNAVCPSFIRTDMGGGDLGESMSAELTALGGLAKWKIWWVCIIFWLLMRAALSAARCSTSMAAGRPGSVWG